MKKLLTCKNYIDQKFGLSRLAYFAGEFQPTQPTEPEGPKDEPKKPTEVPKPDELVHEADQKTDAVVDKGTAKIDNSANRADALQAGSNAPTVSFEAQKIEGPQFYYERVNAPNEAEQKLIDTMKAEVASKGTDVSAGLKQEADIAPYHYTITMDSMGTSMERSLSFTNKRPPADIVKDLTENAKNLDHGAKYASSAPGDYTYMAIKDDTLPNPKLRFYTSKDKAPA